MAELKFDIDKMVEGFIDTATKRGLFVGRWIPVSERLPEKDELYLVYFEDGEYNLAYFSNGAFSYSGVIAWMPLPEPYKESEG